MVALFSLALWVSPLVWGVESSEYAGKAVNVIGRVLIRNEQTSVEKRELKPGEPLRAGDIINTASNSSVKLLMTDKSILDLSGSTLFKVDEYKLKNGDNRVVGLSLDYGKLRASINKPVGPAGKFTLRTKAATMGVRGTEFLVSTDLSAKPETPKPEKLDGNKNGPGESHEPPKEPPKNSPPKPNLSEAKTEITVVTGKVSVTDNAKPAQKPIEVSQGKQFTATADLSGDTVLKKIGKIEAPKLVDIQPAQMKILIQSAKLDDSTFKQAIVLDTTSGHSSGGDTLAALSTFISNAPTLVPGSGELSTPGTFKPQIGLVPITGVPPGAPVNLQVVFHM